MKSKLTLLAKAIVTVLLFFFIFQEIDFHQFASSLSNARLDMVVIGFLTLWIGHYLCVIRWGMLMRPLMPVSSFINLFGIYCIGLFFNLTLPTTVGGDAVKMYYAGRPSKSYTQSFAATFLDRDAGMLAMMTIACIVMVVRPVVIPGVPVSLIIGGLSAAFLLVNIAIFTPFLHRVLAHFLHYLQLSKIAVKTDMILSAFQVMSRHWLVLAGALLISFINQLLVITVTWIISLALGIRMPLSYFFILVPIIVLISMIPVSLNGMGLREYAFMSLFSSFGVPLESCLALGLLSSVIIVLCSLPGGVLYIFYRNRSNMQQIAAVEKNLS